MMKYIIMRTAKEIFEEELSGEPLTQESVIEAIRLARREIYTDILNLPNDWNNQELFELLEKSIL